MRYAKLENGALVYAPAQGKCKADGRYYYPMKAPQWEADGYKPIREIPPPEDAAEKKYTSTWEEQKNEIVRVWTEENDYGN